MPARVANQRVLRRARLITPATWDPAEAAIRAFTLTNGDKSAVKGSAAAWKSLRSTTGKASGKHYVEIKCTNAASTALMMVGLANAAFVSSSYLGDPATGPAVGVQPDDSVTNTADFTVVNTADLTAGAQTLNKVYAIALDMDAGKAWFANDNTYSASGDPAAGTNPWVTFSPGGTGALFMAIGEFADGGGTWTLQAASGEQTHSPPSGFTAWG